MIQIDASYDPADNKIRMRASARLDRETYDRVKAAGFIWAPKQDLFVAPVWTPEREDLALELAGEIGDEDTTLVERAEERADRFEGYQGRRAAEAESAHAAAAQISQRFEFGQPMLVGHHSYKRALKDKARVESGLRKAVNCWATSEYWERRAAGAVKAAKHKERADVRARRIKTIEADRRKVARTAESAARTTEAWTGRLDHRRALMLASDPAGVSLYHKFTLAEYPRQPPASQYEGDMSLWSALDGGVITAEQARALILPACERVAARSARWLAHYDNRLTYERAMLAESGYTPPPKPAGKSALPLLNYAGQVTYRSPYGRGDTTVAEAVAVTKAQLARIHTDYKGTRVSGDGTHRVRVAVISERPGAPSGLTVVYLADSKQHARPGAADVAAKAAQEQAAADEAGRVKAERAEARARAREAAAPAREAAAAKAAPFRAMAEQLKAGVVAVSAPQLFPTPPTLAARMVALAGIRQGDRVLEPSAGTGAILRAIAGCSQPELTVQAVEINASLADALRQDLAGYVVNGDFLAWQPADGCPFDRILMNPPFVGGADIRHIKHALSMLRPGGRLVAICADGPRQREALLPLAETWESLPPGTFDGTGVRAALLVIDAPAEAPHAG